MADKALDVNVDLRPMVQTLSRVRRRSAETKDRIDGAIKKAAFLIDRKAKQKIQKGQRSGRVYRRRSVTHRASAPGEPPKTDTGRLVSSIRAVFPGKMQAEVGSLSNIAKYGKWLEEGTSRMEARPWLAPTLEENADEIQNLMSEAIKGGGLAR